MWLIDPKNKMQSVTLTLFVISFVVVIGMCIAEALGKVKTISASLEVLYAMAALYLGRKIDFKTKNMEVSSQGTTNTDKESE